MRPPCTRNLKHPLTLIVATVLTLLAMTVVVLLHARVEANRNAEVSLARVLTDFNAFQGLPYAVDHEPPEAVKRQMQVARDRIERKLLMLRRTSSIPELRAASVPIARNFATNEAVRVIYARGAAQSQSASGATTRLARRLQVQAASALTKAEDHYAAQASRALARATYGSAATILILLVAFCFFFVRSSMARSVGDKLAAENEELLTISRREALTDALTGLDNRRALYSDLAEALAEPAPPAELMLAIFDLNGFKQYNDTFGHLAGDDLLIHLAGRLKSTVRSMGKAYRLGGDEFCVVARVSGDECEELVGLAATALSDAHNAVAISASYGVALLPSQTTSAEGALRLADQRMYAQKTQGSRSAARQSTDVLLQVLAERTADPSHHNDNVARLAERVALTLGLNEHAIATVVGAAKLHDIGKVALPDAILDKAGPLNEDEWTFMRRHTLVGERIMLAAPALTGVAELVRFSHERVDGNGYPDQLKAGEIPIGARIIAVCNAFDTMVSERPYAAAKTTAAALAELHRCAGTQFDAEVVTAFEQLEAGGDRAGAGVSGTPPGLLEALSR